MIFGNYYSLLGGGSVPIKKLADVVRFWWLNNTKKSGIKLRNSTRYLINIENLVNIQDMESVFLMRMEKKRGHKDVR